MGTELIVAGDVQGQSSATGAVAPPESRTSGTPNAAAVRQLQTSGGVPQAPPVANKEIVQSTLGEDYFLDPALRQAALHLDVPFDADVQIEYEAGVSNTHFSNHFVQQWVRSRGRYRNLALTGLKPAERTRIDVTVYVRVDDGEHCESAELICRKWIRAKPGDRKYLRFTTQDFNPERPKDCCTVQEQQEPTTSVKQNVQPTVSQLSTSQNGGDVEIASIGDTDDSASEDTSSPTDESSESAGNDVTTETPEAEVQSGPIVIDPN